MSLIVDRAIERAGLGDIALARERGGLSQAQTERVRGADLLALGALADRIRAAEVGEEVRIYTGSRDAGPTLLPGEGIPLTGLDLLREVAIARISGPRGARVCVDFAACGLELAQVALGFGADELKGGLASKRGLPIAEDEMTDVGKKSHRISLLAAKKNELAGYVQRAGRVPLFVGAPAAEETP